MISADIKNRTFSIGSQATITCSSDDELVFTKRKKKKEVLKKPRPSYTTIGDGMKTHNFESYPYEQTLLQLSANEAKFFSLVLKGYDRDTGYSYVDTATLTASEKTRLSLGYTALKERKLLKRVRQKVYLINPTAKIHLTHYDTLQELWDSLA